MTTVLGLSAFYHDSAAALVIDGAIVAAAQEERFSRKKHDPRFPRSAINYCLEEAFIDARDIDAVCFYDDPVVTVDRVVRSLAQVAPSGREQWEKAITSLIGTKIKVREHLSAALGEERPLLFAQHHASHAASAFFPSPFESAAILTLDGVGEWATTTIGRGEKERIEILQEISYPHSLGLLYSAVTYFCGFKVNSGEYKLMGLAPYGVPRFADMIRSELIDLRADGSFRLNTEFFGFVDGLVMTNPRFDRLFGGSRREPEAQITRREMDIAASIQAVTEEAVLTLAEHAREVTGERHLVMAGGVALNCVATGKLLKAGGFDGIWVQPAAGDAGGALGAALLTTHHHFGVQRRRLPNGRDSQLGSYLGPRYSSAEIRAFLDAGDRPYHVVTEDERATTVARALANGQIVGFFCGRMEFGPRALGARSILGDPRDAETQATMNLKIKFRESFRPFAPSVLADRVSEYFELDVESPYMLLVAPVIASRRLTGNGREVNEKVPDNMLEIVRRPRSDIPAVTHVDFSARVQTVNELDHPEYHAVIAEFARLTGYALVVNTSFNVRGEPIVCTPEDAYRCFSRTEMDLLVLEDCILWKEEQRQGTEDQEWRNEYELD